MINGTLGAGVAAGDLGLMSERIAEMRQAQASNQQNPDFQPETRYRVLDRNGDGALTALELDKMKPALPPGPERRGVDFQLIAVEQQREREIAARMFGDNPAGRLIKSVNLLRDPV